MKVLRAYPSKTLKDVFKLYNFCSISKEESQKHKGVVIDDGLFEFSFIREKDVQIESNGQKILLPQAFGIGKLEKPSRIIIPNKLTYITLKIQPWVSSFFFSNDTPSITDLSKILYPNISILHSEIFKFNNFERQIKLIEDFFLKQDLPDMSKYEISKEICSYIYENQGNIIIKDLLAQFQYSRQKLNQLFSDQTQKSIKELAILTRLRAIMEYRMNHPEESLTKITYKFGYFDQSHFIKDMKKVTGLSPSEFSNTSNFFFEQLKNNS